MRLSADNLINPEEHPIYLKWANLAREYSLFSDRNYKVCALIVKNGNLISYGTNKIMSDPKGYFNCSIHAELNALLKSPGNLKNARILVYRFRRVDGSLAVSKPCINCQAEIAKAEVGYAIYLDKSNLVCKASYRDSKRNDNVMKYHKTYKIYQTYEDKYGEPSQYC